MSAIVHRDTIDAEPLDDLEVVLVNHVLSWSLSYPGGRIESILPGGWTKILDRQGCED
jgi:hypothetical protein